MRRGKKLSRKSTWILTLHLFFGLLNAASFFYLKLWTFPSSPFAIRIAGTTEEPFAAERFFNDDLTLFTFRTFHSHFFKVFFSIFAVRKTRAGNKFSKAADSYYQLPLLTIGARETQLFRFNFDSFGFFPNFLNFLIKRRPKILNCFNPRDFTIRNFIQVVFHLGGKGVFENV